ncbi:MULTISPECIES: bifunctional UDP-sugar hydrolase/5'-nucleotidase UshA [Pasteurellaceae]|uniref:Bifunctional UDP-sugar hydrolase/5'-nucleotidase UshA n=1 Tax=Pasteurella atlantica TaxID=2827233 RepID=A0AAW8CHB9_9PAST|nr:bifunctional UDP-sugar hydrolase/5'-nucleotidase UshA [Pasteurella atlantica]MBR0573627.1 bifunctional UDP-sugar hydrolase/5'-nucleotidase [Pasteurella atlantica]MDP8039382.1 bifunctional UDP-sugar hydrolase/5'-nucleotidase UshA [Pasteurella atlantica]MDP8041474.1 bifunctional UDP-sugar hydrolase/5'-nucleotidase UshA [Pasteurella atlantica]MDP8043601.1 bifunctional UDP-sugar hydrolase/5'-nucleotidase UshA [Pasteurella atlantica]MDP8045695.1 bifunctional UDP-sugar hydrolase/5'-nucleotidase U
MKNKLAISFLFSALTAGFVGVANATEKDAGVELTVLHTNDHHGHFWRNKHGEYGMAARKTLIDNIRKEVADQGGYSLLFSGGDINTGVPESDMQNAEPDFKGMTKLGYDAMALGNHEFDNPLSVLKKQQNWANFPFLAANIYDKKTGERVFKPYQIFIKGGVKIAVIGLTTEDTMKIGNPEYISGLEFRSPVEVIKQLIPEIKQAEKPDLIFAITHMGHYQNANYGINAPGDVTLARSLPEGYLDMIIGGHSQNPVCMEPNLETYDPNFKPGKDCRPDRQNGTWIVQAHEWGKYVGRADFNFKEGKLVLNEYKLIPVNLKKKVKIDGKKVRQLVADEIKEDQEMLSFLTPYQEKGEKALNVKIGQSDAKLIGDRDIVRTQQTNLGRLIATAQKEKVQADVGIMNSGGVRDSIEAGDITYKDVLKVQPFANTVVKANMKGADLKKYLEVIAVPKAVGAGAYPQFSGISMTVKNDGIHNVKINGEALDNDKVYTFTVPSFNAAGGDGYPKLTDFINTGFVDAEVLKSYIQSHSPLKMADYEPKNEVVFENQ